MFSRTKGTVELVQQQRGELSDESMHFIQLSLFSGYSFGIPSDVSEQSAQPREMIHLVVSSLKACGASIVHEVSNESSIRFICAIRTEDTVHFCRIYPRT